MPQNRLAQSTSPYLLQHADNPVDWWPWCDEALQLAREQNKPILLSIGYSACHWCHVMAHESFEDADTATVMNELFINIKVDREERPDLDKIYQTAHQLLSRRSGGWPLTVFLMPEDHAPFFAGTYFPKQARHGLPAFVDLMRQIHQAYHHQTDEIRQQNVSLQQAMERLQPQGGSAQLNDQPIQAAIQELHGHYDDVNGGIGSSPKFPHPNTLELLLRYSQQSGDAQTRQMTLFTLQQMANGGMNDLLGGGFCRYSVDDFWMIPHFEKMLYDNGPLLALYANAWQADQQRPLFKHVCERTAEWVMREMQSPAGGYYASLDADSEGEEGKFYVWQRDEVIKLLDDELTFALFAARYGLNNAPNFEGQWHLHSFADTKTLAKQHGISERDVRRHLKSAREILFAAREQRIRPDTDDKILTSWNALMIKGMAQAGHLLQQPTWLASAEKALAYLRKHHWQNGRLLATSKDGKAHLNAYLDDYAYLLDALLTLLQARWRNEDLAFAQAIADALLAHFYDPENGGFYFTSDDHEQLMQRMKSLSDDAMPSGNAVAAQSLQRLGLLLGETRYLDAAEKTLQTAWDNINRMPYAHPGLLIALAEYLQPVETLIIRGSGDELLRWQTSAQQNYAPHRQVYAIPAGCPDLPEALASKAAQETTVAYRCIGLQCNPGLVPQNKIVSSSR